MYGYQNRNTVSSSRYRGFNSISTISKDLDKNFRPINILVFRNGDSYDQGLEISVTRRQFPNWLTLLDYLTAKLHLTEGAVHSIFTLHGDRIRTFQELEDGQWYVGAHGKFRQAPYGTRGQPQWKGSLIGGGFGEPKGISSKESLEMYLRSRGYKPILGDVWDDSQFDLMKSNGAFHSPLTRRREYSHALEQRRRSRAPSRARSADGIDHYPHAQARNSRRSRTEETIHRNGSKTTRTTRSLPSGRIRLPTMTKGSLISHSGTRSTSTHFRTGQNDRPGTATMSSRATNRRSLASAAQSAATQRAMQWNAKPTSIPVQPPPPPPRIHDEEGNMYKPVDPRVARAHEDRAYQFYERQKELQLKRGILERAAKRPPGPESIIKSSNSVIGAPAGRPAYDSYARRSPQHVIHTITTKPPPYRLQAPKKAESIRANGRKQHIPPLKSNLVASHPVGSNIEKSPRWVEELTGAVERLAREVSTLSRRNQHLRNESVVYSRLYDSD